MSVETKIVKNDFDKLVKELKVSGSKYNEVKQTFARLAVNKSNDLQQILPDGATGNLKNSVFWDVKVNGYNFNGVVGAKADYGLIASETGRKPGSKVPAKQLERWAQQKLGDKKLAYAVAKKIEKRGTRRFINKGPRLITEFENEIKNNDIPNFIDQVGKIIVK